MKGTGVKRVKSIFCHFQILPPYGSIVEALHNGILKVGKIKPGHPQINSFKIEQLGKNGISDAHCGEKRVK